MNKLIILIFVTLLSINYPIFAQDETTVATAIFAGGCFWCTESDFEKVPGVIKAESGYTGGHTLNPTYKEVSHTNTGHYEAVQVTYEPSEVSYQQLVDHFWYTIDPTDAIGQFCDKGGSYRSAFFYENEEQQKVLDASLMRIKANKPFEAPIVTKLLPAKRFYLAEDYHQDYYKKNPIRYRYYRNGCGRDKSLKRLWGEQLENQLSKH